MCDEFTAATDDEALARKGLTRREFAAIGAAAAVAACARPIDANGRDVALNEAMVEVTTPDGKADAFFVHPASGKHPGVIFWPDALGLRDVKRAMARRLAASGYAVLVVNQYYRTAKAPHDLSFAMFREPGGREKLGPLVAPLTSEAVTRDGAAYAAWLDTQPVVDKARGIGTQGYCMGGPMTVRTAAASQRVKAAASFHGGGLVTDKPDSPHRLLASTQASFLIAIARDDDARAPGDKEALKTAATAAGRPAEIEVYPADHGWCVPDAPAFDQAEADRAWARLLVLYGKL